MLHSLALDLYEKKLLDDSTGIQFQNPFNNTTMIAYNYKHNVGTFNLLWIVWRGVANMIKNCFLEIIVQELNTWDDGNMLTYPIKCQDLDTEKTYNETVTLLTEISTKPSKKTDN